MIERLIKKASKSHCAHKVSAMAFSRKGNLLGFARNTHRFNRKYGGIHAEAALMKRYGAAISYIIICRTNNNGKPLPIHPCEKCQKIAKKLGITIRTIA